MNNLTTLTDGTSISIRLSTVGLRGITLLAKFSLIFALAHFLTPQEVALYGLMTATISYSIYGLGFDFYTYSTRELLGKHSRAWAGLLRDQGVFFICTYLLVLPALALLFVYDLLPWRLAPWFFILLVLEHLAQELNRLLVATSRQLLASAILFLRMGLWILVVILLFVMQEELRSLNMVFAAWITGASLACIVGGSALCRLDPTSLKTNINWVWIKRGIAVAVPLLFASLAVRGLFTIDRYWVRSVAGVQVLAAYVLFAGVANAITSFLDSGVFVFLYPRLIAASKQRDYREFTRNMRRLLTQTVFAASLLAVMAGILIHPLLEWLDKPTYSDHLPILYVLLLAIWLYAVGMVPHYGLYSLSRDKHIILSQVTALPVFIVSAYALTRWSPIFGVPVALCLSFSFILMWKLIAFLKVTAVTTWEPSLQPHAAKA